MKAALLHHAQRPERIARKIGLPLPATRAALAALARAGEAEMRPDGYALPLDMAALRRKLDAAIRRRGAALAGDKDTGAERLGLNPNMKAAFAAAVQAPPGKAVSVLLLAAVQQHYAKSAQPCSIEDAAVTATLPLRLAMAVIEELRRDLYVTYRAGGFVPRPQGRDTEIERLINAGQAASAAEVIARLQPPCA